MRKPFIIACQLLAVGIMLLGQVPAQQTPAASAQPSQPASSQASSNQSAPATKSTSTTAQKAHEEGGAAQKAGEEFLAANKGKEGVVTLPSGMQYKILTAGSGPKPTASDTVSCNYKGTLLNGKEFDSSYKRGHPETFPVGGVIKGWTEALLLMPVGSKWQLFIPADLAYGDRGAGGDIGPGETLIFEVELLSIGEQKK